MINICKINEAITLCLKSFSYYCDKSFKCVHEMKENKEHKKETIDYNISIDTRCQDHSGNNINLFCIDEKVNIY